MLADTTRNVLVVMMMLLVGFLVGFDTHTNVLKVIGGVALMLLFGFAVCWIFAVIGLAVHERRGRAGRSVPDPRSARPSRRTRSCRPARCRVGWSGGPTAAAQRHGQRRTRR